MATKANPGQYDCYSEMDDDEPHFVLRGTGMNSPGLVRMWAFLKSGQYKLAQRELEVLQKKNQRELNLARDAVAAGGSEQPIDQAKIDEALACAKAMEEYYATLHPDEDSEARRRLDEAV
jgi:hypothetical protein